MLSNTATVRPFNSCCRFVVTGIKWPGGKAGGKRAHKPGDFGIHRFRRDLYHFSGFGDWALREKSVITPLFFPLQYRRLDKSLVLRSWESIMFSFFSSGKVKRVLFAGLVFVLLACFLGGCKTEVEDESSTGLPDGLLGKWVAGYGDNYVIAKSGSTETLKYYYDSTTLGSEGTIRDVTNFNSESGVIIVEYSSGLTNADRPFGAVYYLDFTGGTVSFNSAWDATAADYDANTATLDAAIAKFTQASMGNYIDVSYAVPYTKQN